jgi:hypothetical protein
MRKTALINDCSHYHVGCQLVAAELRRHLAAAGLTESPSNTADLVLVNGEGSLHHNSPHVSRIEQAIADTPNSAPIVLVNASWQAQMRPLNAIEFAIARESLSATEMIKDRVAAEVLTIPDISLCCHHQPPYTGGGGLIVIDSVDQRVSQWLEEIALTHKGRFIKLCQWNKSPEALIDLLATADAVITGRFHGVVFAMLAGAPFIAAPSNTWKTRSMLQDLNLREHFHTTAQSTATAYAAGQLATFDRSKLPPIRAAWKAAFERIATTTKTKHRKPEITPQEHRRQRHAQTVGTAVKTVVLVGNGPSIQNSRLGQVIDAHDEVIRFNAFQLSGFETDLGTKTTLWSTFGKGTLPADSAPPRRVICVHENAKPSGNPIETIIIPHVFYERMRTEIRAISKHKNADKINPTSGFLVIRWLLENGCPRLNLAGFDHFSKERSGQHHYWSPKSFGSPADHDGTAEAELLFPFIKARKIAYLT